MSARWGDVANRAQFTLLIVSGEYDGKPWEVNIFLSLRAI